MVSTLTQTTTNHIRNRICDQKEPSICVKYRNEITYALFETDAEKVEETIDEVSLTNGKTSQVNNESIKSTQSEVKPYKQVLVWRNIAAMAFLHLGAAYGSYMILYAKVATICWAYWCMIFGTLIGIQAGAHRHWAHKTYKANFGIRVVMMCFQTLALQNDIFEWSRDHRAHHKFSETDADPHDSKKGFFFCHMGWLLAKKHPDVVRRGKTLDMSDLEKDPVVAFQREYYIPLVVLFWAVIPTLVPVYLWGESGVIAVTLCVFARYVTSLHLTWFVNSWAHIYGYRAYDQKQGGVEASIRHLLVGEGFHNYHHSFPWDYSASEFGAANVFNPATAFIDLFHWMGWAWDLKKVNPELIDKKKKATGDPVYYNKRNTALFEWFTGLVSTVGPLVFLVIVSLCFGKY